QRIQVFDGEFQFLRQWTVQAWMGESIINKPYLAIDAEGRVYTTDPEGSQVLVFSSEGELLALWGKYGTDEASFDLPTGIALDAEGHVYVSDSNNHRVMEFPAID
ncbi:MAG TPA: NHL repeat-containing protein, partial [Anaerolineae bacterium]|nr:NHL repeat-containing protein [Anaerolineae bacterium]